MWPSSDCSMLAFNELPGYPLQRAISSKKRAKRAITSSLALFPSFVDRSTEHPE